MTEPNALVPQNLPKWDLVGPTVDDDIRRAIARYGAAVVKEAATRLTKPKRGRAAVPDWQGLYEYIEEDARDWLNGGNPLITRSKNSIAKAYADKYPGQSHPSTMKRIIRKLNKKRTWMTLIVAEKIGESEYPFAAYLRTVRALQQQFPADYWQSILDSVAARIADYEVKLGEPPSAQMSVDEMEKAVRNAPAPSLTIAQLVKAGGISGLLAQSLDNKKGSPT